MPDATSLAIVLPAFNEAERIGPALDELFAYLSHQPGPRVDVVVVDDGSADKTADLVRARPEMVPAGPGGASGPVTLRVVSVPHGGKGAAVRAGVLTSNAELIVFADADMATPPDQLPILIAALTDADIALGSRIQPDGFDMRASQPPIRRALGKLFHAFASVWVVGPVADTQCGFKGFRRAAAHDLFARQQVTSIVFDVELIYLARRRGYRMSVVPITWNDRRGSRMRPGLLLSLRVAWDLFRIPLIHRRVDREIHRAEGERGASVSGPSAVLGRASALSTAFLPVTAVVTFIGGLILFMAAGAVAGTWGYDFHAYAQAAERLLAGQPLYDSTVDLAGGFAIFLYPPPFAIAFIPFALLGTSVGLWAWTALLTACAAGAIALMPVSARIRWVLLLMAGISWPTLYAIRLGQVGPILLLIFVLGWRWLDRPIGMGGVIGAGVLIKIQPGLIAAWAVLTGRWKAAAIGLALVLVAGVVTLPVVGIEAWRDYTAILGRVSQPITTPHNFTPGAVLYQAGLPVEIATLIQWAVVGVALTAVVVGTRLGRSRTPVHGYMTALVASQLVSPILWDHYAVVLFVPIAWLVSRGHWWTIGLLIATSIPFVAFVPAATYPAAMLLLLFLPLIEGLLDGRRPPGLRVDAT